jgi:hypothetical protein
LTALVAEYEAECERSRQAIAGHELNAIARSAGSNFSLRYALAHMMEETARDCGHLDLLRESIDGVRGQRTPVPGKGSSYENLIKASQALRPRPNRRRKPFL